VAYIVAGFAASGSHPVKVEPASGVLSTPIESPSISL